MTSVDSNFNFLCGRPPWLDSPPPVHMRPPKPDYPFRVDIINGWPLNSYRRIILLHLPPLPYSLFLQIYSEHSSISQVEKYISTRIQRGKQPTFIGLSDPKWPWHVNFQFYSVTLS